jgi:serine/threonine protein kinase/tetratricopeptide (TPR) repeat protein
MTLPGQQPQVETLPPAGANALPEPARASKAARRRGGHLPEFLRPRNARSVLLQQVVDEYYDKVEKGQRPNLEDFCARFPRMKSFLVTQIVQQDFIEQHPELISVVDAPWPAVGEKFLHFVLVGELGCGTFARVYLAVEPELGNRHVVVKVSSEGPAEAHTLGRLNHPNIVPVHSVGEDPQSGLSVVCMPYLGHATLDDVLELAFEDGTPPQYADVIREVVEAPASAQQAAEDGKTLGGPWQRASYVDAIADIATQIADALAYLHARELVHGDLKPSNVLMSWARKPMLLDFNLSLDRRIEIDFVGGTVPYMAPEQLEATVTQRREDCGRIDARSDLFALGVILYQLLSGQHPFGPFPEEAHNGEHLRDYLLERQQRGPNPLRRANPRVDTLLARIVEDCLACAPGARPGSAAELVTRLHKRQRAPRRLARWAARRPLTVALATTLLLSAAATGAYSWAHREPAAVRLQRQADAAFQTGAYDKTVALLGQLLTTEPRSERQAEILYQRARALRRLGQDANDRIAACADQAEKEALQADRREYWKAAWHDLDQVVRLRQGAEDLRGIGMLYASMGYCRNQAGDDAAAVADYERALQSGFVTAEIHNNLAFSYYRSDRPDDALQRVDQAIALDPRLAVAYQTRAQLMLIRAQAALRNNMIFLGTASPDALLGFLLSPRRLPNAGLEDIDRAIALGLDSPGLRRQAAHIAILAATGSSQELDRALRRLERQYEPRQSAGLVRSQSFILLLGRALHAGFVAWARDERLLQRAVLHLERAVELGLDPAAIKQEAVFGPLWAQSRFRTLLKTKPSVACPVVETHTVDPTLDAHF